MSDKEKLIKVLSILDKLQQCTPEAYEEIKYTLLATVGSKNPELLELIKEMCRIAENNRPKSIEMRQ